MNTKKLFFTALMDLTLFAVGGATFETKGVAINSKEVTYVVTPIGKKGWCMVDEFDTNTGQALNKSKLHRKNSCEWYTAHPNITLTYGNGRISGFHYEFFEDVKY